MFSAVDHAFMAQALRLAERGLLTTTPNPRVGCVLAKEGVIVGEGWHERAGEAHAEVRALVAAGTASRGATAYVTLEPCSHFGKTPPCADALMAAGVARVVAAMADPNPQVAGRGLEKLRAAGIETACGLMEAQARELNIGFVSRMERGRPWLRLKAAASLDGKTALNNGQSQWITSPEARQDGHRWRARACAILTGIGTIKSDDPQLNVRNVETTRQPLKVVVDSRMQLPLTARVLEGAPLLLAVAQEDSGKAAELRARGAEILSQPNAEGKVDLLALLQELAKRGINEVHVEGGAGLNGALLQGGLVDELLLYLAPCLIGNVAQGLFALPELEKLDGKRNLKVTDLRQIGSDLRVLARFA
ncbi:MAG: Riboflavin biosynthesis protein RibD [Betaproteobacteria bacterium ADurb.Bin341]|nr:MAG: Riboflavin biosynthesis protein RibD [Betaproteobacteria bacterium ADurb.Bin341]